ncbi:MAG: FtsX-like permease family protein [Actinomycetota bacterium]
MKASDMRRTTLRRRRTGAQRTVLAAFALIVFVVGGVSAGLIAYVGAAGEAGARAAIDQASNDQLAAEIAAVGSEEPLAEDTAVTEHLTALLRSVPHDVYRSRVAGPRKVFPGPDGPPGGDTASAGLTRALLASYQDLPDHADLVEGQWQGDAGESEPLQAVAHARSARELGIGVGDLLSVMRFGESIAVRVTGLYLPREPGSRYWAGERREIDGTGEGAGLVLAFPDADLASTVPASTVGADITHRWRLEPAFSELPTERYATLESSLPRLLPRLRDDARLEHTEVEVDDTLADTLADIRERLQAAQSVAVVPLVLLGFAGLAALGLVGRLLTAVREPETSLLRSRGATAGLLVRWTVREALPVVVLPAALGGGAAWLLLRRLPEIGTIVSPLAVLAGTAAAATAGIATLILGGVRAARTAVQSTITRRAELTRGRAAVRAGTGLVTVVASAVMIWQLRSYGGLTVTGASGTDSLDPLAVAAPAVALLAAGVVVALVVPGVAWAAARLASRRRGLSGVLANRQVARRPGAYALPMVLVALTAGWTTLAASFTGTWAGLQADVAAQRTGADLQVVLPEQGIGATVASRVDLQPYRDIPGAERVRPAVFVPGASFADGPVGLLAAPSGRSGTVPAIELPPGAESVHLDLEAAAHAEVDFGQRGGILATETSETPPAASVHTTVWAADADGVVTGLQAAPIEVPTDGQLAEYGVEVELPPAAQPWRVLGVEWHVDPPIPNHWPNPAWSYDYEVAATSLRTDPGAEEAAIDAVDWTMDTRGAADEIRSSRMSVEQAPSGFGFRIDSGGLGWDGESSVRLTPGEPYAGPIAVVATESVLDRSGHAVGDETTMRLLGTDLPVEIADEAELIPGTSTREVLAADLGELHALLLSARARLPAVGQIRIDLNEEVLDDGSAAAATEELASPDAEVLDRTAIERDLREDDVGGVAVNTFWVAGVLAVLLAGAGLAAAVAALARQRDAEVAVLRSLGCAPGEQARARLHELALTTVPAIVLGTGAGWLVARLTAALLANASTPGLLEAVQPAVRVAAGPLAGLLGGLAVVCLAVAVGHAVRVRRQSSTRAAGGGVR